VISAPPEKVVPFPLLDFYRAGGNMVGINSLLHDLPACANFLDALSALFDGGTLAAPRNISERSLDAGVAAYHDVNNGCAEKMVLVM
jgi:hypothetical protein